MDEATLAEIYRTYGAMVFRRCFKLLRDEGEAHDMTQEVFVRGVRHVNHLRPGPELLGWLYRAATNLAFNRLRDMRVERSNQKAVAEIPAAGPLSFEAALSDRRLAADLLAGVDETTRLLAVYVFIDGMTHDEAGQLAGVAPRTVRNKLARFLERGRKRLGLTPPREPS